MEILQSHRALLQNDMDGDEGEKRLYNSIRNVTSGRLVRIPEIGRYDEPGRSRETESRI
jgi:hypothetical protein